MFGLFGKRPEQSTTEADDDVDPEDLSRATFIQQKCQVGALFASRLSDPAEDHADQLARYQRVRAEMIATLDLIEDEFCRGFAAHQIIKMCMVGGEEVVARALLTSVRDKFIREKIFEDVPELAT